MNKTARYWISYAQTLLQARDEICLVRKENKMGYGPLAGPLVIAKDEREHSFNHNTYIVADQISYETELRQMGWEIKEVWPL